jgi:hypothetical protein
MANTDITIKITINDLMVIRPELSRAECANYFDEHGEDIGLQIDQLARELVFHETVDVAEVAQLQRQRKQLAREAQREDRRLIAQYNSHRCTA